MRSAARILVVLCACCFVSACSILVLFDPDKLRSRDADADVGDDLPDEGDDEDVPDDAEADGPTDAATDEEEETSTGQLQGTVTDGEGLNVSGALVEVFQGETAIDSTLSNSTGAYSLELSQGTYDVEASKTGHRTTRSAGVMVTAGDSTIEDLVLPRWWNPDFGIKYPITIDPDPDLAAPVEFPVKLLLDSSSITYTDFQGDGGDVRFIDGMDAAELDFFIESWDPSGTSIVYVETTVHPSTATTIHLYGSSTTAITSASDATSTFGADLMGYWSLNADASDLSAGSLHGTVMGATHVLDMMDVPERSTGHFAFDGAASWIDLGDPASLKLSSGQDFTVSAWILPDVDTGDHAIYARRAGTNSNAMSFSYRPFGAGGLVGQIWESSGSLDCQVSVSRTDLAGGWHHVLWSCDLSVSDACYLYLDGALSSTATCTADPDTGAGTGTAAIGRLGNFSGHYFDGAIDEVRVYRSSLDEDVYRLLYHNPGYSVGLPLP